MIRTRPAASRARSENFRANRRDEEENHREDEIKLLFDGKRPKVEQRRRWLLRVEVVRSGSCEMEIGEEDRRPSGINGGRVPIKGPKDEICPENSGQE